MMGWKGKGTSCEVRFGWQMARWWGAEGFVRSVRRTQLSDPG
jgi:hypothetical protein